MASVAKYLARGIEIVLDTRVVALRAVTADAHFG
jgi:hypothetical protein